MIPTCMTTLIVLAIFAALQGFITVSSASSAMHQIYGAAWWVVFAVCVAGTGTMYGIWRIIEKMPNESAVDKEKVGGHGTA